MFQALERREAETLDCLSQNPGFANRRIDGDEQTVKTHVGNVLAKLGLRDRIHAVILAYEAGLIQPGAS